MEKAIRVFYHIYFSNHYKSVVQSQLTKLFGCGLYDRCDSLFIGATGGSKEDLHWLHNVISNYKKITLVYFDQNLEEKNTLRNILTRSSGNDIILYMHTKGVSRQLDYNIECWRNLIEYKTIHNWKECIKLLDDWDTIGPLYRENTFMGYYPHYSGGFWWANRDYIETLDHKYLNEDHELGRMGAEFWIGSNPESKMYCNYNFDGIEPYIRGYSINEYI
jgi:hypothetical protein